MKTKFMISNFKLIVILMSLFVLIRPIFPADETNQTPPAAHASSASGEVILNQAGASAALAEAGVRRRDPFWPVGFFPASMRGGTFGPTGSVPSAPDKKTAPPAASLSEILRIGGVVKKGDKFYATINGLTVQTGEVISAVADGEVYKFVVEMINFDKVQFKPVKK